MIQRISSTAAVLLLACAALAQAAPVQFQNVPADAKWLVHVDVDAARSSKVVQKVYHDCVAESGLDQCFDKMADQCAMDPRKDLHSVTLFGSKIAPRHGVMVVRAQMDKARLKEAADKAPDHAETKYRDYTLHTWTHEKHGHEMTGAGALVKPDVLVLASGVELLKQAIDVLDGKGKALADDSPLAAKVPQGTIVLARAAGIGKSDVAEDHPICDQLASFDYAEGERDGTWFGHVAITADDAEAAKRFKATLEGFRSMVWLHLEKAPELRKLLDRVEVSQSENTVKANFEAPAEEVAQAMTPVCQWVKKHWIAKLTAKYGDKHGEKCDHKDGDKKDKHGEKCDHRHGDKEKDGAKKDKDHGHRHDMKDRDREERGEKGDARKADRKGDRKKNRTVADEVESADEDATGMRNPTARQGSAILGVVIGKPIDMEAAEVVRVRRGSAAAKAGLKAGDIVVQFGDQEITSPEKLRVAVLEHKPGDKVTIVVKRDGDEQEIEVELGGGDDFGG